MPWKSKKQAAFGHANPEKFGGEGKLSEWDSATDWQSLPETSVGSKNWMSDESNREKQAGTQGVFSAAAARAGKSTAEFADAHANDSGKLGRRARMAKAFMGSKKG